MKPFKKLALFSILVIIIFILWFIYALYTDSPPQFFPLNNTEGIYVVTKKCPAGQGWNKDFEVEGPGYCLEYEGPDVFGNEDHNSDFFRITVGDSKVNLAEYVGKKITKIEGEFVSSSKQCIKDDCIDIGGPFVVLNIDSIEE